MARKRRKKDGERKPQFIQDGEPAQFRVRQPMPHVAMEYQQVNASIALTLAHHLRRRHQIAVLGAPVKLGGHS